MPANGRWDLIRRLKVNIDFVNIVFPSVIRVLWLHRA